MSDSFAKTYINGSNVWVLCLGVAAIFRQTVCIVNTVLYKTLPNSMVDVSSRTQRNNIIATMLSIRIPLGESP